MLWWVSNRCYLFATSFYFFFLWELSLCYLTIYPQINGSNRQPFFVVVPNSASQQLGLSSAERFVWSMLDLWRSLIRREACWGWRAWDGFTVMYGGWQAVGQVLDVVAPSTLRWFWMQAIIWKGQRRNSKSFEF